MELTFLQCFEGKKYVMLVNLLYNAQFISSGSGKAKVRSLDLIYGLEFLRKESFLRLLTIRLLKDFKKQQVNSRDIQKLILYNLKSFELVLNDANKFESIIEAIDMRDLELTKISLFGKLKMVGKQLKQFIYFVMDLDSMQDIGI